MIRVVLMTNKAYGKEVSSMESDIDGRTLADEGNVVIYCDNVEDIEKQLNIGVTMLHRIKDMHS